MVDDAAATAAAAAAVVGLVVRVMVVEGAGLNEEEAELTGDGSMDEAESMHRAESRDEVELLRLLDLRCCIHECWILHGAVSRLL